MTVSFVLHRVADYDAWRRVYDRVPDVQRERGVTGQAVYRAQGDPNNLLVMQEFRSSQEAHSFFENPQFPRSDAGCRRGRRLDAVRVLRSGLRSVHANPWRARSRSGSRQEQSGQRKVRVRAVTLRVDSAVARAWHAPRELRVDAGSAHAAGFARPDSGFRIAPRALRVRSTSRTDVERRDEMVAFLRCCRRQTALCRFDGKAVVVGLALGSDEQDERDRIPGQLLLREKGEHFVRTVRVRITATTRRQGPAPDRTRALQVATCGSGRRAYRPEVWSVSESALLSGDRGYDQVVDSEPISGLAFACQEVSPLRSDRPRISPSARPVASPARPAS